MFFETTDGKEYFAGCDLEESKEDLVLQVINNGRREVVANFTTQDFSFNVSPMGRMIFKDSKSDVELLVEQINSMDIKNVHLVEECYY